MQSPRICNLCIGTLFKKSSARTGGDCPPFRSRARAYGREKRTRSIANALHPIFNSQRTQYYRDRLTRNDRSFRGGP